jgi:MFS family permease
MKPKQPSNTFSFWVLFITQTFSLLGSRMTAFAVGIWVYEQTHDATPLALIAFFETAPMVLLSNLSGMIVDRFDRRRVLLVANLAQAVVTLFLLWSFGSGHFQVWHVYLVAALQAAFGVFIIPAFQSSVTLLVTDKMRDRANALNEMAGPLAGVIAPGAATALYALTSVTGVIVIDLFSFIVAGIAAILIFVPRPTRSAEGAAASGSFLREIAGGFNFLKSRRLLLFITFYFALLNFLFMLVITVSTPYILSRTDGSREALGLITSILNLGAIVGGIVMSIWGGTRPRIHTILGGVLFVGGALVLLGIGRTTPVLAIAAFLMLFPLPMINAAIISIMQVKVPADLQGRVFSLLNQVSMVLSPIAALAAGPLADTMEKNLRLQPGWATVAPLVGNGAGAGIGLTAVIVGVLIIAVTVVVYLNRPIRQMEAILPDYGPVVVDETTQLVPEPTA